MKALNRLTTRRFPATDVYTIDQARELSLLSRALGRQLGMLIDRKGRVDMVLVGEAGGILIPELPRARSGADRLRGLRLLHTHLTPDGLSQEDLMDLLFLRLDAIIVLTVNPDGDPVQWQEAHLLPTPVAGQPYRVEQLRPWDQTSAHFAATAEALEEELARRSDDTREASDAPRALLVSVAAQPRIIQERNLDELAELARTAGLAVAGRMVQRVAQVNPKFILGKGKMAELEVLALEGRAGTLVFDGELSPAQLHNLADITERKVLDRTQLILDIFAQHAVTRAGKLQVELAQLRYTQPRLTGKNRAMDRLMGGIGGRGPGETKLETDRRRSRERMARLRKELDIPVFHDDQHGTAIVVSAGLLNALRLVGKKMEDVNIVINGAGSAGISIAKLLLQFGAGNIVLVDRAGAVSVDEDWLNPAQRKMAEITNRHNERGSLADVMKGKDVFIGVSAPKIVTAEMVSTMAKDAIVFAMPNPTPEIMPEEAAKGGARVIATGRSDYPNQINNVLVFPGIFRGALDAQATDITEDMKLSAARAIASIVSDDELKEDYIIPGAFDKRVAPAVAKAVMDCAKASGISKLGK